MKIKVLYVITKSDVGGAQKYVHDLATRLNREHYRVSVLFGGDDIYWLSNKTYPWLLFFNDWIAVFELVFAYRSKRPHIVHLNSSKAAIVGSLAGFLYNCASRRKYRLKIVFTAHGWVFNPTNVVSPPVRLLYRVLHTIAAFFQHSIITVSEYDREIALRYRIASDKKIVTIHNGIDPDMLFLDKDTARKKIVKKLPTTNYRARRIRQLAEKSQLPTNTFWVGSLGRLTREKHYQLFIDLASHFPHLLFFIIGDGPEKNRYQACITHHQLYNFFLVPSTGEDSQFLLAFDIFVMTSVKEGLPYALLEAEAAGLPSIVTRAGGMPEVVQDQHNGLVVPQRDLQALSRALALLTDDQELRIRFGKAAETIARTTFHIDSMVASTEAIYTSLASNL